MKIIYIITRGNHFGGAQIHVRDISIKMKELGHLATVFVGSEGAFTESLKANEIPYIVITKLQREIHLLKDVLAYHQIRKELKLIQPDIVSCHASKSGVLGRLAARNIARVTIFTAHGWAFTEGVSAKKRYFYAFIEKGLAKLCNHIITVSQKDFELACDFNILNSEKISAIHNGLPFINVKEKIKKNKTLRMIMVARFQEQKDHQSLIKALTSIKEKDWTISFVGDGPLEQNFKEYVRKLGFEEKCFFLGQRNDVAELLEKHDLFLLISNWEGFPRSTIEAMRASLPVIVSNVGGSSESIKEGVTGFSVPRNDVRGIINKISFFLDHPEKLKPMGEQGRAFYEAEFTFNHMFTKTYDLYKKLLKDI